MNAPCRLAAALLSAAAFALSLPNEYFTLGQPLLGYVALVPLYLAIAGAPTYRAASLTAALYGAIHQVLSSYWLFFYKDYSFWTVGASAFGYAVVYAVLGLFLALFMGKAGKLRPIAFALLWAAFEYQKSTGFLGYPWGLLPYTQTRVLALLQIAELTGVYGLGFVLALANASIAELTSAFDQARRLIPPELRARRRRPRRVEPVRCDRAVRLAPALRGGYLGLSAVALSALFLFGEIRLAMLAVTPESISILMVQQNVDPWLEGEEQTLVSNVNLASRALAANAAAGKPRPELIVFSEGSLRRPWEAQFMGWFSQHPLKEPLLPFLRRNGIPLFTGAPVVLDWKTRDATNSTILVAPDGRLLGDYAKTHPVPFAEAIPFWEFDGFRRFMQETVGLEAGWTMGKEIKLFSLGTSLGPVRFGSPICFEDAFSAVCRDMALLGADFLLNVTNDAWSRTVSAELQHYAAARFRSIELRMPMLRSTNAGLSCVIDARGEVISAMPLFTADARIVGLPLDRDRTPTVFQVFGEWFAILALSLCGLMTAIIVVRDRPDRRWGRRRPA